MMDCFCLRRLESAVDGRSLDGVKRSLVTHAALVNLQLRDLWPYEFYCIEGDQWPFSVVQLERVVSDLGCISISNQLPKLKLRPKTAVGLRITLSYNGVCILL